MQEKKIDYSALAQIVDTSWGRSSTSSVATFSVKFQLLGSDRLKASYVSIVNFGSEAEQVVTKRRQGEAAGDVIKAVIADVKKQYKAATGDALKIRDAGDPIDSVEIVGHNPYNPKKTARFHRVMVFEVG